MNAYVIVVNEFVVEGEKVIESADMLPEFANVKDVIKTAENACSACVLV